MFEWPSHARTAWSGTPLQPPGARLAAEVVKVQVGDGRPLTRQPPRRGHRRHPLPYLVAKDERLRRVRLPVGGEPAHVEHRPQPRTDRDGTGPAGFRLLCRERDLRTAVEPDLPPLQAEELPFPAPGFEGRLHERPQVPPTRGE